jgi:hypothetical protein
MTKKDPDLDIIEILEEIGKPLTLTLSELMQKEFPPVNWIVRNFIPNGGSAVLSGSPGSYKSFFALYIALKVARGEPLFDKYETDQGNVLIVDKENIPSLIQLRCGLFGVKNEPVHFLQKDFFIDDNNLVNEICIFIKDNNIKLVIFDSLIRIYKGRDENSANDMAAVFETLHKFQKAGAAVLIIHHNRKTSIFGRNLASESIRGSSDILAAADSHISVKSNEQGVEVSQTKLRQALPFKPFKFRVVSDDSHIEFIYEGELEEEKQRIEQAKEAILTILNNGEKSRTEIIGSLKGEFGEKIINSALRSFTSEQIQVRKAERGKKFYSLANEDGQSELDIPF